MKRRLRRLRGRLQRLRFVIPGWISYALLRPKAAGVNPDVVRETWDAVADGAHNSNTDLTFFDGWFYLCHQTSPYHLGSRRSRLLLWRSRDARSWEKVTEFKNETGREYRDPTFAQIRGRLFVYVLPNLTLMAEPVTTMYSSSDDGLTWAPFVEVNQPGWLYWRPKTTDGATWYVTAYWNKHGRSMLFKSSDGVDWSPVSQIYEGERNDETDFEFMPDGRIIATARLEGNGNEWGDATASTLIAVAERPFMQWTYAKSYVTRLDGPCLFPYNGRVYAFGRQQVTRAPKVAEQGGMFSRKRTSIYLVEPPGLRYLTDVPSAGDTSYAGIVIRGDELIASYYTSPPERDYTWILGMFRPSNIRVARIDLPALERLALLRAASHGARKPGPEERNESTRPAWQRITVRVISSKPGASFFRKTAHRMDVPLMRISRGRLGMATGYPSLLLTTKGAKSGKPRTVPLLYVDLGDEIALIGTRFGSTHHPGWCHNLRANPAAIVDIRGEKRRCVARAATDAERDQIWRRAVAMYSGYARYETRAHRTIPIMVLSPAQSELTV